MTDPSGQRELGEHHVEQLREKLLDLSNGNRLLNFKHSPRSRTHVRIIDELPEFLLDALCEGRELAFQSLGAEPVRDGAEGRGEARTPEDVARELGITPSYDLPEINGEQHARHADRFMQTLLFDGAMERKLSGIRQEWQTGLNERGVDTLFAAFGFLEWFESDSSNKVLHAPLLLHPLEMDRTLLAGHYEFRVRTTGEESQINLTLAARLRRDFGLVLPELEEEARLADYLDEVQKVTGHFERWRIRRFVTVGIYGFARLVMYRDLDECTWSEGQKPAQHPLVRQLLSERTHAELITAEDYPLDDAPHVDAVPPLVSSADSSQTSAIVDVLQGKSLALKGPPGTGKSQTITNLIAAALHQGKSVLFVAEKMAALEVVQKRLADAGLAEFCLELHSTRAKKTCVLERLRARMQLQNSVEAPGQIPEHRRALADLRARLNHYVRAWNAPVGRAGLTVHDAVWQEQACRQKSQDIAATTGDLRIATAGLLRTDGLADLRAKAKRLTEAAAKCEARNDVPTWRFVRAESFSVVDIPVILRKAEGAKALLVACTNALAVLDPKAAQEWTCSEAQALAEELVTLPSTGVEQPLLSSLGMPAFRSALVAMVEHLDCRAASFAVLRRVSTDPQQLADKHAQVVAAVQAIDPSQYVGETVGTLRSCIAARERRRSQLESGQLVALRAFSLLGVEPDLSPGGLKMLASVGALLRDTPRSVLRARSPHVLEEQNGPRLLAAMDAQRALIERERTLSSELNLKASPDAATLRGHAIQLRTARWYSWVFAAFRLARSTYLQVARGYKVPWRTMADRLDAVAECAERRAELRDDPKLKEIVGSQFNGADTDFETLHAANVWARQLRQKVAGTTPQAMRTRRALLSDSIDLLDDLLASLSDPAWEHVVAWLDATPASSPPLDEEVEARRAALAGLHVCQQQLESLPIAAEVPMNELGTLAGAARVVAQVDEAIRQAGELARGIGSAWAGRDTDVARLRAATTLREHLDRCIQSDQVRSRLSAAQSLEALETLRIQGANLASHLKAFTEHVAQCSAEGLELSAHQAPTGSKTSLAQQAAELDRCLEDREGLTHWIGFLSAQRVARASELAPVLDRLRAANVSLTRCTDAFEAAYHRSLVIEAFEREPILGEYVGLEMNEARRRFRVLDEQLVALERQEVAARLCTKQPPAGIGTGPRSQWTERALIENELSKKIRHVPIRQLMGRAGNALRTLAPCFMMSPISVAQYLPPGQDKFDLLVIDEASQMRTEDALGALNRAKQTVVVGDPKQLPPTAFFQRMESDDDDDDDDDVDEPPSAESILDLALGAFQPARDLRWHYRSKHESLIAFSNHHFYDDRLQIFPSPEPDNAHLGVELRLVKGTFQASVNDIEARAVAEAAVEFMEEHPERSLGVVAMNQKQSQVIEEYVDELARTRPMAEAYRTKWSGGLEPFFVKNLENVQGDERDAILIGMTYGPCPKTGKLFQRFGPINGASGHRRLNVLFTRAKERVIVLSSMSAADIYVAENSSLGVRALKAYLQYANNRLLEGGDASARAPESPFEEQVIGGLRDAGYQAIPQIGVRGFFIDIGIKHPSYPHGYLCGVECDGASYHSSRTARDRDRLREDVLTRLGWRLVRVWSTDWFSNPIGELQRLVGQLDEIRAAVLARHEELRAVGE